MNKTIYELFEEQMIRTPNNIAVRFEKCEVTYLEFSKKVDVLATILRKNGVVKDSVVGLFVNRSLEMLVSIVAILKAGGAYLPIDTDYPYERIQYMITDSNADIIITQKTIKKKIFGKKRTIYLDMIDLNVKLDMDFISPAKPNDLAYIIYTSGSTGNPKGVMIEHNSVVNFIYGICEVIDFYQGSKILALTSVSFDIFVLETLLPLTRGLMVVLAQQNALRNPKLVAELINDNEIDMLQLTPSMLQLMISYEKTLKCLKTVRILMIGGERFTENVLIKVKMFTIANIYNMYGPTETTIWSTVSDLTYKNRVDIGRPILNTVVYILDDNKNIVPDGVVGELFIGGESLARGYIGRPDLTSRVFIESPFEQGKRLYKTGDLVKRLPDGNLEYIGRLDNQVKIRGYRIELEEVEKALSKYKFITQSIVKACKDSNENCFLCAFYISDISLSANELKSHLSLILPYYMIPSYFIRVFNMPQNINGKVDRAALSIPENPGVEAIPVCKFDNYDISEYNDIVINVVEIINHCIDVHCRLEHVDIDTTLHELGINSIDFIKIIIEIEKEYGFEFDNEDLSIDKFFCIGSIATYISKRL